MNKLIVFAVVVLCCTLVALAASSASIRSAINKKFSDCSRTCTNARSEGNLECREEYKSSSDKCKSVYLSCRNASEKKTSRIESIALKRNCSANYTRCKTNATRERISCMADVLHAFLACKENCKNTRKLCLDAHKPVCGVDGKDYPNDCALEALGIAKLHDGLCDVEQCSKDSDCPILVCIRAPCPGYRCIDRKCVLQTCGNGICEEGEADFCPQCRNLNPPCMLPCEIGTCPEDCEVKCQLKSECSKSEFCLYNPGQCKGLGKCQEKPEACNLFYQPVCGCDGKTYSNDCVMSAAGVSKRNDGECREPACEEYRYSNCPADCEARCVPSCNLCADCDGQQSCVTPKPECSIGSDCKPYFSSCSCSWTCVNQIPKADCDRFCPERPKEPSCTCESGKCSLASAPTV
jgi:hypothetical protein